jgi:hypothetical protein
MMYQLPQAICHHCGETIAEGEERATGILPNGVPKAFCKFTGENPDLSCWHQFQLKRKTRIEPLKG